MSLAQYVHPSRSTLPVFLHLQYHEPHKDLVKHCSCTTPEMCTCPQIHEAAVGNKVSSLLWPYCEEVKRKIWLLGSSICLCTLSTHCRSTRTTGGSSTAFPSKISHRSAQSSNWVQLQPRIPPVCMCPHLFTFAPTLQCNLPKPSSVQVSQCNFTLGQGKGTREKIFPFPRSTKYELHLCRCWPQFFSPPIQVLQYACVISSHTCLFVMGSIYDNDKCGD